MKVFPSIKNIISAFCLVCFLPGCLFVPQQNFYQWPSHSLKNNPLYEGTIGGQLWDRSEFILKFPLHILTAGDLISKDEQKNRNNKIVNTKPSAFNYDKNEEVIGEMLSSDQPTKRGIGLEILNSQENLPASALVEVTEALTDPNPYVRIVGIHLLPRFSNNPRETLQVQELLKDPNEFVRLETIRILPRLQQKNSQQFSRLIHESLNDASSLVRLEAIQTLKHFANPESIAFLEKIYQNDPVEHIRQVAYNAIQSIQKANIP